MWDRALIFFGGVVLGAGATFLFMKKKMELEIEEQVSAQVEDVKAAYAKADEREEEDVEEECAESCVDSTDEPEVVHAMDPDMAKKLSIENMKKKDQLFHVEKLVSNEGYRTNYNAFSNPMPEEDVDNEEDDDPGPPKEALAERPYTISQEEFIEGRKFHDQITLYYYDDGILEEALNEEIIQDVDAAIGLDSLTKFGEYEEDVVFVRNERTGTDYEVIRQYRDYAQFPRDDSD